MGVKKNNLPVLGFAVWSKWGHSCLYKDNACPARRTAQGTAETEPGIAESSHSGGRKGTGCCLHRICMRALVAVSKKVSGQQAGGIPCFKGRGGRCKAWRQTNKTLEIPFISGRWRSETQSGSNKKLSSVGSYSPLRARGAGVGVLGSMLRGGQWKRSSKPSCSSGWACPSGRVDPMRNRHWTLRFFSPLGHLLLNKALGRSQWRGLLKRLLSQYSSWLISQLWEKGFINLFLLILSISVVRLRDKTTAQPLGK